MSATLDVVRVFCADDGSGGNPLGVFIEGAQIIEDRRQDVARDLGYSETVFVDDLVRAEMRIFTPEMELPLAGHPLVGTAWLLRERGHEPAMLRPPAGDVPVSFEGGLTRTSGRPEWCPPWEFVEVASPDAVDALTGAPDGYGMVVVWAWLDEDRGLIRQRVFPPEAGIAEDEATGSAAMRLSARVGRPIEIRQGRGSVIYARPAGDGMVEISGRVVADETREYALG